ncbi:MAG: PEGA domain-containing protein [Deltaproteobacteria bacterium]|nr:PEGA domain-containing protein [Deltaproteobacteria bacterium]
MSTWRWSIFQRFAGIRLLATVLVVAAVAVVTSGPSPALAEEGQQEAATQEAQDRAKGVAQQYIKLGEDLFRQRNHAEAVESFLRAESTLEKAELDVPVVLYRSIARCYDQLGQILAALANYKKFLALSQPTSDQLVRAIREAKDAEARLQRLLDRTSIQLEVKPDGAEVRIDQQVVGRTPLKPLKVAPGPHQVTESASCRSKSHDSATLQAGRERGRALANPAGGGRASRVHCARGGPPRYG